VTYPNLGMGIAFTKVSEEDRRRLRDMLRSISPASVIVGLPDVAPMPSASSSETVSPITNAIAALQAITNFFENRHMMGREEFLNILRKSQ
jgi:hypothetical protein